MTDFLNDLHPSVLMGAVLIAIGITVSVGGIYYAKGWVKPNWITGIRTFATLRDDQAWHAAHRSAAVWVGWSGARPALAGLVLILWRPSAVWPGTLFGAAIVAMLLLSFVAIAKANQAARNVQRDTRTP